MGKRVFLTGGLAVPYDKLMLAEDLVDSTPLVFGKRPDEGDLAQGRVPSMDDQQSGEMVKGFVSVSRDGGEATTRLVDTLLRDVLAKDQPVVVYGSSLASAACVAQLLDRGVQAHRLTLVRPQW